MLDLQISVKNLSGHKFPTAYPSRRAWVHVAVRDARGKIVFESGGLQPDGSIAGNDNDVDPQRYEPHRERIDRSDQVQIYESVMVDQAGRVTTGLLSALRYVKDNRLLPAGFDKATAVPDIAVHGHAMSDADFVAGRDQIRYVTPLQDAHGPLTVSAEILFQSIGYRWAHNLKAYDAPETQRFLRYFTDTVADSALTLTSDTATVAVP